MRMNSTNFKQYDTRWDYLPYPTNRWNIGNSGCGEVSIANIIIEMNKWLNDTPKTIQPYCVQYAAPNGDGTYWSGIPAMMKHYGFTDVMEHDTMQELFAELAKGNRVAVYLMGSAPAGEKRVHWTSGGHFVSSVLYEKRGSEDWVYMKDPNSTSDLRNGWMSYTGNIRGACLKVWSGKIDGSPAPPQPTPTPTGKIAVDGVGGYETVKRLQEFLKLSDPDGLIGRQRRSLQKYYPAFTAVSFSSSGYSNTIMALQKWLGLSDPDGIMGKNTTSALQRRLRDYGYFDNPQESIDGIFGAKSMRALQTALNNDFKDKTKPTPPTPPTPTPTTHTKVIDVSYVQKSIDWAKVKASGIVGAMVRCGYRGYETGRLNEDDMFLDHIKGAYNAGLKVGVYFFTEAIDYAEGREEAEFTLKLIEKAGVTLYYPIAVDTEAQSASTERAKHLSVAQRTDAIKGFCEGITAHGGKPMIYASTNWFENKLDMSKLPYDCWCAQYYKECEYKGKVVMWQYTSEGMVSGVQGVVDMNNCYITSPAPMPKPTPQPTPDPKPYSGAYPTEAEIREASRNGIKRGIIIWDKEIADSGKYHYVRFTDAQYTHECPICTGRTYDLGWNCIGDTWASWRHGGGIPCRCNCEVINDPTAEKVLSYPYDDALALVKAKSGLSDVTLIRDNNGLSESDLQIGDIILYYKGGTYLHTAGYVGGGKIADCSQAQTPNIQYGKPLNYDSGRVCKVAIRYTGSRSYMKKGDEGDAVAKLQDYLNWYTDGRFYKECGGADGIFGNNTHKYVVAMQTDFFGASEADGTVGQKTIAKMKEVRK